MTMAQRQKSPTGWDNVGVTWYPLYCWGESEVGEHVRATQVLRRSLKQEWKKGTYIRDVIDGEVCDFSVEIRKIYTQGTRRVEIIWSV